MFSPAQEQQIYHTSRYLLGLLQPRLDRACRLQVRTWLAEALEQGAFVSEAEEIHTIPNFIVQLEVACLIHRELGLNVHSILAVLLYMPFSAGRISPSEIKSVCGEEVLRLLQLLARTSELYMRKEAISSENFHNLLISMAEDMRVVLIIIAYRLYLLRHASMIRRPEDRKELASEVSFLYAPIAHRLGLYKIKGEMEDLCLMYLQPKIYGFITRKLRETKDARDAYIAEFIRVVRETLLRDLQDVSFEMKGRVKSVSSISNKLKKLPFEDIYDVFAIRIIVDVPPERERQVCWQIYSIVTDMYRPNPERLKDWISIPKSNGYESLHTTVLGPENRWVEVQIRSKRMDAIAEQGVAAHWRYKRDVVEEDHELEIWLDTIREVLNHPDSKGMEFLDTVHLSLYAHDITVFTPKGRPITLPLDASVLDFAYAVHTDLGDTCIGAKVNHKVLPLSYRLSNGDQVEILTSKMVQPEPGWLNFVATAYAKVKIETALRRRQREAIAQGEALLTERLKSQGEQLTSSLLNRLTHLYRYDKPDTFLRHIGDGTFEFPEDFDRVVQGKTPKSGGNRVTRVFSSLFSSKEREGQTLSGTIAQRPTIDKSHPYELIEQDGLLNYKIAPCCHPIPGDDALGIISDESEVIVHKCSCPEATRYKTVQGDRLLSVHWSTHHTPLFETTLVIRGIDSKGLLNAISQIFLEDFKVSITAIDLKAHDGVFQGTISVKVLDTRQVEAICQILRRNPAIHEVYRLSELDAGYS